MNLFNSVLMRKPRSNAFNLSYAKKLSFKFGQLIPVHVQECIPGDVFRGRTQVLMRFAPMLAPIMHQVDMYCHYFFVPNRILWKNWEKWITGDDDVSVPPYVALNDTEAANGTLCDYLGLPSSDVAGVTYSDADHLTRTDRRFNAFPFAAYQRIWLEYYRDKNLQTPDDEREDQMLINGHNTPGTGEDPINWATIRTRAWQKDYFASALPWAQKGDSMLVPIGFDNDVPVYTKDPVSGLYENMIMRKTNDTDPTLGDTQIGNVAGEYTLRDAVANWINVDAEDSGFMARTSALQAGSATIQDLRTAFRLQEWLEKNARGGTRYVENILAHFGIRVRDYRLNRPEMIGGGVNRVQISEVLQTSRSGPEPLTGTPLAEMGGHGIAAGYAGTYNYRCEEHGFIIGIMSCRPRPAYMQGVPRQFSHRQDRLDYYWPSFAHLGEQAIVNSELYYTGADADDTNNSGTFGYTPRYSEYRRNYSDTAGDFNTSLDFWHLARKFPARPVLNSAWIQVGNTFDDDLERIFAVQDGTDYLYAKVVHDIKAIRPMPRFATPTI